MVKLGLDYDAVKAHQENGFLSDYEQPVSNAAFSYGRVLEYDPGNPEALNGLQEIADIYEGRTREYMQQQDNAKALTMVQAGLAVVADHPGLISLQDELKAMAAQ